MRTYLAEWPDGTFTVCSASNLVDLFWTLDEEGDPYATKSYLLPSRFEIVSDFVDGKLVWDAEGKKLVDWKKVKIDY